MEDKIYERLKEDQKRCANRYAKAFGMNDEIISTIPKKNLDLLIILKQIGLLPEEHDKLDELNDFHDYLFKFGIELGIPIGKQLIIDAIQSGSLDFEKLSKVNPEDFVTHDFEPTFVSDFKEAIVNEK